MKNIVILAHNIRSTHNVGSIFRTADGFGVSEIILSGYSPYPELPENDPRLPHLRAKTHSQIAKTALGTESTVPFSYVDDIIAAIAHLKSQNYQILALEQSPNSTPLPNFSPSAKFALLLGEEVHGIPPDLLSLCDHILEIPMLGQKESFNVSVATGIALYKLVFE